MQFRQRGYWLPLCGVLALGCSGSGAAGTYASGPSTNGTSSGTVGGATSGSSTTGAVPPLGGAAATTTGGDPPMPGDLSPGLESCPTATLPKTPLRRLTRFEYKNTIESLLNIDASAASELPADSATNGFDNLAQVQTVSELHAEKYVLVSETLAAAAVQNLSALTSCEPTVSGDQACALEFAREFGRRAFRRPLTSADEQMFMAAFDAGFTGGSFSEGIEVMIRAALVSPNFLYRLEVTPAVDPSSSLVPLGPFELATRLSYLIWASGPDDALLDAAATGQLDTKEQVAARAREMLTSDKAQNALGNFLEQWSGLSRLDIMTKNTTLFPSYSLELRDAMAREFPAFLNYLVTNGQATLGALLTANVAFVQGPLAELYGVAAPVGSEAVPTLVNPPEAQGRAGLLTMAGLMAVHAHPDQTSPVLRGKFVRQNLLCNPPPPPPDDVDISVPEATSTSTARERAQLHLSAGAGCAGCHAMMDPIGLAFEHFDSMGNHRLLEAGQTIDVSGEVLGVDDPTLEGPFTGAKELADKLAASDLVRDCVATQLFRFASGRAETGPDACSIATLQDAFSAAQGDLNELIVGMTQTDAFLFRPQEAQ